MLKVVGTAAVEHERLELNGYTLTLRWNDPFQNRIHIFWRTGKFPHSLLEVGLNVDSHVLETVTVVNIHREGFRL